MIKVGIVDYGMGNIGSIKRKLDLLEVPYILSSKPSELENVNKLILPGVGHFSRAVQSLKKLELWDFLDKKVQQDRIPILGICLGMQLMARTSEEGDTQGFGWFEADVKKFSVENYKTYKIPHMGWNSIDIHKNHPILKNIDKESSFYFVHGYYIHCHDQTDILCSTTYENKFTSAIQKDNIIGFQFHPEKSHDEGLKLLENFIRL